METFENYLESIDGSFLVYHGSNRKLTILEKGQWVTTNKEVAKSFGVDKSGGIYYLHYFKVKEEYHPLMTVGSRQYVDIAITLGDVRPQRRGEDEGWKSFITNKDLKPIHVEAYKDLND